MNTGPENIRTEAEAKQWFSSLPYEQKCQQCTVIAKPLASETLANKCYALIQEALKHPTYLRYGLKHVQARIRKGETGVVVFAGNVTPIDVICHMPAVCEKKHIPYVYVPSKEDLGTVIGIQKSCLIALIKPHADYKDFFEEVRKEIDELDISSLGETVHL